ncbi:S41 family peptidase [Roseateles sp. BYS87W]|uniref:S41 family peptidase n=1 Tax=Pelomonas baiyunensis TaxID=3299026 RepID=A0ABW7GVQ3_9BURK
MKPWRWLHGLLGLTLAGLLAWGGWVEYRELSELAPVNPAEVVDEVVAQLQQRALNAAKVDWPQARRTALETASSGRRRDLDLALDRLVRGLEDGHSFYLPVRSAVPMLASSASAEPQPLARLEAPVRGVSRLAVDAFSSLDAEQVRKAAAALRALALTLRRDATCGWLLDLTRNRGGNMFPMLQGLSPWLPEGDWLQFEDASGARVSLRRGADGIWLGAQRVSEPVADDAWPQGLPPRRVAVLLGAETASSGEMVALAFKALPHVLFFGRATAGLTSGNELLPLRNGGLIAMTTTRAVDRAGHVHHGSIAPDQAFGDDEAAALAAAAWVVQGCSPGG